MAKTAIVAASATVIESISISRDAEGRYSLNDLHRAAMMAGKATENHAPSQFLRNDGVKAFVAAYDADESDMQKSTSGDAGFTASVGKQVYAFQTDKPPRGEARDVKSRFRARLAPEMRPREPHRPEPPSFTPSSRRNQYGERHHHPYLPRPRHQLRR